jgi:very-short-patch-repair endonuclease
MKRKNIVRNARELRQEMTEAERKFWMYVRDKRYKSIRIRRQHPIGSFVLDFYWAEKKIGIEIDGGIHKRRDVKEHDEGRTQVLDEQGIRIIRFTNEEVMDNVLGVLKKIVLFAEKLPHPA